MYWGITDPYNKGIASAFGASEKAHKRMPYGLRGKEHRGSIALADTMPLVCGLLFDKGDAAHYVHSVSLMPVGAGSGNDCFCPAL